MFIFIVYKSDSMATHPVVVLVVLELLVTLELVVRMCVGTI